MARGGRGRGGGGVPREVGDADDVGGVALVTGVEDAAEFVVGAEDGVGFVDEEGGLELFDEAKEGGGADVGGGDGAVDEFAKEGEEGGLAAAFDGGFDADVGGHIAEVSDVGVEDPEGEGFGGPLGEDKEAAEEVAEFVEEEFGVDGFGPGLDGEKVEGGSAFA